MLKAYNFKIQVTCPGCNTIHPVSSLLANEKCENCGKELIMDNLIQNDFESMMVDRIKIMNGFLTGALTSQNPTATMGTISEIKMICWSHPTSCEECKAYFDDADVLDSIKNKKPIFCKKCNHPMPVRPADEALKKFHPKAIGVINDSRGFDVNADVVESKKQTVVFSCMTCGAGLQLDESTKRLTKCTYCENENYLPDAIWNRLHPFKEPERLYLILDLEESDLKESLDYFFKSFPQEIPPMFLEFRGNHFAGFIKTYFTFDGSAILPDSIKSWWKMILNTKYDAILPNQILNFINDSPQIEAKIYYIEDLKDIFFSNFRDAYNKLSPEVKEFIAGNIFEIPDDIRDMFSKDPDEKVRVAIANNIPPEKPIQAQTPISTSPAGSKSKRGCIILLIVAALIIIGGVFIYKSFSSKNGTNIISKKKTLEGRLIDVVMIPGDNNKSKLWVLTDAYKGSKFYMHYYIYDPYNKEIIVNFDHDDKGSSTLNQLLYINDEVWCVNRGSDEPGILVYDPVSGVEKVKDKNLSEKYPELKEGIGSVWFNDNPDCMRFKTKDGKEPVFDIDGNKMYGSYLEFHNAIEKDSKRKSVFKLETEKNGGSARQKLYLAKDSYSDGNILLEDKVFLEGKIIGQDGVCCFIFHQSQVGEKSERILTCVDIKGNILLTASTEKELFKELGINSKSPMAVLESEVHAIHKGDLVLFKYEFFGFIGFSYKTGEKLYEVILSDINK